MGQVDYLKDFMTSEEWDKKDANYIAKYDLLFDQLGKLLKKSLEGLQEAKTKYQEASTLMERNDKKLENRQNALDKQMKLNQKASLGFNKELARLNRRKKAKEDYYNSDANGARGVAYGSTAVIAPICATLDFTLTFGK